MDKIEIIKRRELTEDEKVNLVKILRKETGFGLMLCKRYLFDNDWDYDNALYKIKTNRHNILFD